jgi:uridine monophosphate synthetase
MVYMSAWLCWRWYWEKLREEMTSFFQRLESRARRINSLLCVGLDPHIKDLEAPTVDAVRQFCLRLVDETADLALAFKPNSGFFEAFGSLGWQVLKEVIEAVPGEIPVILDAKRGDIASTAEAYAQAVFETLGATAVTASPYLGRDSVEPFLRNPERGVFLLCKTSNPGSGDLQDLVLHDGRLLYEQVAGYAEEWNVHDNVGLVVGATHPEALKRIRRQAPDTWLLAPGIGAQGGEIEAALQAGLRADGLGMLIPVSRAISRAADPRAAALGIVEELRRQQSAFRKRQLVASQKPVKPVVHALMDGLLEAGCVKFGQFTLKSGAQSPIYLDLRQLVSFPALLTQAAAAYREILEKLSFDRLAAIPYAALPIGSAISLQGGYPLIYPRKEVKAYGTKAEIEGLFQVGETAVVIDDLATTGGSKFEAVEKLLAAGLKVRDVVVLIDRQSGAAQALEKAGYHMHAVMTLTEMLDHWAFAGKVPQAQIEAVRDFLRQPSE